MKVAELQDRAKVESIEIEIVSKGTARDFTSRTGETGRVCDARGKDETGEVTISLWNDDIEKVAVGQRVRITNGWASTFRGQLQVSAGKFGKMEIL